MLPEPVPADPGKDEDPAWLALDPVSAQEREAWLDHLAAADEPPDLEEEGPGPEDELTAAELAEVREAAGAQAAEDAGVVAEMARLGGSLGAIAAVTSRRGPGQPGSARVPAGESSSRAAAFGTGMALDVMPACPELALAADAAVGPDDCFAGVSDAELAGLMCAWERLEAHMAARKLAAAAELIRRRPEPGCPLEGTARMPAAFEEFTADERPQVPGPGPRPRRQAAAPGPGPARHLHQPGLSAARQPARL